MSTNPTPAFGDLTQPLHVPSFVSTGEGVTVPTPYQEAFARMEGRNSKIDRLERELQAKDAEIARLSNEQEVKRHLNSFRADEELKATLAEIAAILPKRGHDTISAARDVMQDLAELRTELATATARVAELERQLAEAGEDKARLDWLEDAYAIQTPKTRADDVWCVVAERPYYARRLRAAIDAARERKEGV